MANEVGTRVVDLLVSFRCEIPEDVRPDRLTFEVYDWSKVGLGTIGSPGPGAGRIVSYGHSDVRDTKTGESLEGRDA